MSSVTGFLADGGLNVLTALIGGISSHKGDLIPTARVFLSLSVVMTLMGAMYDWWIKGGAQEMVASLARLLIITSIPLFLFSGSNWDTTTGYLVKAFQSELPSAVGAAGSDANSSVSNALQAIANAASTKQYVDPQTKQLVTDTEIEAKAQSADASSGWKAAIMSLSQLLSIKFWLGIIIQFLVFVLNVILFFAMIFCLYMPVAAMAVGIVIGPILIAWLPFEKFAGWTTKWLDYMIANGLTFVIAILITTGISSAILKVITELNTVEQGSGGVIGGLAEAGGSILIIFAIYAFAIALLLKANEMASGMTGGAAIGEGLFGNLMAMAAAGAVIKTAKLTGKGAYSGAKGGAGLAAKGVGKGLEVGSKLTKSAALKAGIKGNGKTGMALASASNAMSGAVNVAKAADKVVQNVSNKAANSAIGKGVEKIAQTVANTDGHIASHLGVGKSPGKAEGLASLTKQDVDKDEQIT
jgi:hypothetical protein